MVQALTYPRIGRSPFWLGSIRPPNPHSSSLNGLNGKTTVLCLSTVQNPVQNEWEESNEMVQDYCAIPPSSSILSSGLSSSSSSSSSSTTNTTITNGADSKSSLWKDKVNSIDTISTLSVPFSTTVQRTQEEDPSQNTLEKKKKKKYQRKREQKPSEKELDLLTQSRQAKYETFISKNKQRNNYNHFIWDFESLFPDPVWDDEAIRRDLYEVSDRDKKKSTLLPWNIDKSTWSMNQENAIALEDLNENDNPKDVNVPSFATLTTSKSDSISTSKVDLSTTSKTDSISTVPESTKIKSPMTSAASSSTSSFSSTTTTTTTTTTTGMGGSFSRKLRFFRVPAMKSNMPNNDPPVVSSPSGSVPLVPKQQPRLPRVISTTSSSSSTSSSTSSTASSPSSAEINTNKLPTVTNSSPTSTPIQSTTISSSTTTTTITTTTTSSSNPANGTKTNSSKNDSKERHDRALTRMVEERLYGYRRNLKGDYLYDTSLMGDGAVKFRDGVRLGNALQVNNDLLNYHAKREMRRGRLEEAEELYEKAIQLDPRDGRAYLGLSKIAERRRDFSYAKECLRLGIARSVSFLDGRGSGNSSNRMGASTAIGDDSSNNMVTTSKNTATGLEGGLINIPDNGPNPYLLQALGTLEEQLGHLTEAESLYIAATKSRPCHAAAWVALGELRTKKLRQAPNAGRICFQSAERELKLAGMSPSAHVYTAWASLEYKAGDVRKARELYQMALDADPKCSAAWLQLGVLEASKENWSRAKDCFEAVLKFDQRNSRVLQAYAIMESKRPDCDCREVIELFERALRMNHRDGGVYQAYALYVAKLGDIDGARKLLKRGTEVDKRHGPLWQAWGVLESRHGSASVARDVFQQGIWACAQSSGGQSGGRHCARLWQAWGVLEANEKDHAAARRCFNRALDADSRNVAAVTAWTLMEEELGNYKDARMIFERALKQFTSPSDEKMSLWRAYEVMETKAGNVNAAQQVYQRSIKDAILRDVYDSGKSLLMEKATDASASNNSTISNKKSNEVEVVSWKSRSEDGFGGNEVWMADDGSILGKVPSSTMMKKRIK